MHSTLVLITVSPKAQSPHTPALCMLGCGGSAQEPNTQLKHTPLHVTHSPTKTQNAMSDDDTDHAEKGDTRPVCLGSPTRPCLEEADVRVDTSVELVAIPPTLASYFHGSNTRAALVTARIVLPRTARVAVCWTEDATADGAIADITTIFGPPCVASIQVLQPSASFVPPLMQFVSTVMPSITGRTTALFFTNSSVRLDACLELLKNALDSQADMDRVEIHVIVAHPSGKPPEFDHEKCPRAKIHAHAHGKPYETYKCLLPPSFQWDDTCTVGVEVHKRIAHAESTSLFASHATIDINLPDPPVEIHTCEGLSSNQAGESFAFTNTLRARANLTFCLRTNVAPTSGVLRQTSLLLWDVRELADCSIVPVVIWGRNEKPAASGKRFQMDQVAMSTFNELLSYELAFTLMRALAVRAQSGWKGVRGLATETIETLASPAEQKFPRLLENALYARLRASIITAARLALP